MISDLFLQLLQVALGRRENLDRALDAKEWSVVYQLAKDQALVGLVMTAFSRLPKEQWPPRTTLLNWVPQSNHIVQKHDLHVEVLREVNDALNAEKIPHVFMKGLTCGARYPLPESRTCGDIDFLVGMSDFPRTLDVLDKIGRVDRMLVHEHHGMAHIKDVTLEPHYKLHNYQNTTNDKAMQIMVEEVFPNETRYVKIADSKNVAICEKTPVLPMEFEGMFLVSHMVNHVYEEGLGLRQVIDFMTWALECAAQPSFDKGKHALYLKRMRMERPHRIFVRICEKYLGLPVSIFGYNYSDAESSFADKLMADIMAVGNFGRAGYVFNYDGFKGVLQNYFWVTGRALRLGYLCPSEAYMWPICKLVRFFDKKIHPGRYKEPGSK